MVPHVDLGVSADKDGNALGASSYGAPFTVDRQKIHFLARAYGNAEAPLMPLRARLDEPVLVAPARLALRGQAMVTYNLGLRFSPPAPGIYDVLASTSDANVRLPRGALRASRP